MTAPVFGYEQNNPITHFSDAAATDKTKFFGYFPIIGTIIGLFRAVIGLVELKNNFTRAIQHISRGLLEATGLGAIFLLPTDLIVTQVRKHQNKKPPEV
jgi:hypothetical protein